jgi:virulence-associated protein VagC
MRKTARAARSRRERESGLAKVFWTGRSQAVRLPKEFRFAASEVAVRRSGRRVILEPIDVQRDANGWPLVWWQLTGAWPEFSVGRRRPAHERGAVFDSGR